MRTLWLGVGALAAAVPVLLSAQGSGQVTSATIDVSRKLVPAVVVSVTNRYSRPIVSIDLAAPSVTAGFRFAEHQSGAAPVKNSTILNGETRLLKVRVASPASRAEVTSVTFEDGRTEGGGAPHKSIVVTTASGTATDIIVVLHNLRAAAIRAWRIGEYDTSQPGKPRERASHATSLCEGGAWNVIAGRDHRELTWGGAENYDAEATPTLIIDGVQWDDGVAEGTTEAIDSLHQILMRSHCR